MNYSINKILKKYASDLLDVIAPRICCSCGELLLNNELQFCNICRVSMRPSPFPDEIFSQIISYYSKDDFVIEAIFCLYLFEKESPVQKLIHTLKYDGIFNLGIELGTEIAKSITQFSIFKDVNLITYVPLHKAKLRERGYNQSKFIAEGISSFLKLELAIENLHRTRNTKSQTSLNSLQRKINVECAFVADQIIFKNKIVLLCDDVLTTGATLNECAKAIMKSGAKKVFCATVAKDL